jgi:hypothetical protein
MRLTARAATRAGLVGGAALFAAALTISPAQAASADLSYSCDFLTANSDTTEPAGPATASFDSAIGKGLVVRVGAKVSLDPFTGSVTLPDAFTTRLRDNQVTSIRGGGITLTLLEESGDEYFVDLTFDDTAVPAQGPMTVQLTGQGGKVVAKTVGTNTLVASDFLLVVDPPVGVPSSSTPTSPAPSGPPTSPGPSGPPTSPAPSGAAAPLDLALGCTLVDEGDPTIDSFQATAAPTPTVTVTAQPTASPVRPVVVQTDFAGDDRSSALPLVLGGALMAGGIGAVATGRARGSSRRH